MDVSGLGHGGVGGLGVLGGSGSGTYGHERRPGQVCTSRVWHHNQSHNVLSSPSRGRSLQVSTHECASRVSVYLVYNSPMPLSKCASSRNKPSEFQSFNDSLSSGLPRVMQQRSTG